MDVIGDFEGVRKTVSAIALQFKFQQILESALSSLDLRAQDRLSAHVHRDEEVWIWDHPGYAIQSPQLPDRFLEQAQRDGVQL
jgi:hypothetical protein